jgi:hypothetical protein
MNNEADYDRGSGSSGTAQSKADLRQNLMAEREEKEKFGERLDVINYLSKEGSVRDPTNILDDIKDVSDISADESRYDYLERVEATTITVQDQRTGYDKGGVPDHSGETAAAVDPRQQSLDHDAATTGESSDPNQNDEPFTSDNQEESRSNMNLPVIGQIVSFALAAIAGYFAIFTSGPYSGISSSLFPIFISVTLVFVIVEHVQLSIGTQVNR